MFKSKFLCDDLNFVYLGRLPCVFHFFSYVSYGFFRKAYKQRELTIRSLQDLATMSYVLATSSISAYIMNVHARAHLGVLKI